MAHARRKFPSCRSTGRARLPVRRWSGSPPYGIEQDARELEGQPARRYGRPRQPLLDDFKTWLLFAEKIPNGSSSAKAIDYTLKRWAALTHYPRMAPIDNNWIEN